MRRGSFIIAVGFCLTAILVSIGCGSKSPTGALSGLTAEFQSADPAVKAKADLAAANFKTNDYVGTVVTLRDLKTAPGLAPKQLKAVDTALDAVLGKVFDEASKGDPHALEARDALRQMQKRPGAN